MREYRFFIHRKGTVPFRAKGVRPFHAYMQPKSPKARYLKAEKGLSPFLS